MKTKQIKQKNSKRFRIFIQENLLLSFLFLLNTSLFIYQNYKILSWDFVVYYQNYLFLFKQGNYFEILRPILMPFILGILNLINIFKFNLSYFYIFFVSFLFLLSMISLSKQLRLNSLIFYLLTSNIFLFSFGLVNGTELLSLSLFILGLYFLLKQRSLKNKDIYFWFLFPFLTGFFFAMSGLSRYGFLIYFILVFFLKGYKAKLFGFLSYSLSFLPWLIFNKVNFGNLFYSIADNYANNIFFRQYLMKSINYLDLLFAFNFLILFFLIGFILKTKEFLLITFKKIKNREFNLDDIFVYIVMFFMLLITFFTYLKTPLKEPRYLFNLILPTSYFSYFGILKFVDLLFNLFNVFNNNLLFKNKINHRQISQTNFIFIILFMILLINVFLFLKVFVNEGDLRKSYDRVYSKLVELNITKCKIYSDLWIMLRNYNVDALPLPIDDMSLNKKRKEAIFILFDDSFKKNKFIEKKIIFNDPVYSDNDISVYSNIIYFNKKEFNQKKICNKKNYKEQNYIFSYLNEIKPYLKQRNKTINIDPCYILSNKNIFFTKICLFLNKI